eukprot:1119754-Prymnesium_polylepis.1
MWSSTGIPLPLGKLGERRGDTRPSVDGLGVRGGDVCPSVDALRGASTGDSGSRDTPLARMLSERSSAALEDSSNLGGGSV